MMYFAGLRLIIEKNIPQGWRFGTGVALVTPEEAVKLASGDHDAVLAFFRERHAYEKSRIAA